MDGMEERVIMFFFLDIVTKQGNKRNIDEPKKPELILTFIVFRFVFFFLHAKKCKVVIFCGICIKDSETAHRPSRATQMLH